MLANLPSNQLATYVIHFNPQTGFSRILGAGVRGVLGVIAENHLRERRPWICARKLITAEVRF